MKAAETFVRTLRAAGVDTFFGLPGSTEAPLLEALRAEGGIRYVLALHEAAAVGMADGYARASGRAGLVGLHTTVGCMNGMSAVFNAYRDGTPVVVTAGHKDRKVLTDDGFSAYPNLANLFHGFTKSAWQSMTADSVSADLARAIQRAMLPPAGPTFLGVPEDLMAAEVAEAEPGWPRVEQLGSSNQPDSQLLDAVVERLRSAEQAVMVVGTGAAGASAELAGLAAALEIPLLAADLTDLATLESPPQSHYLGVYGEQAEVLQGSDLVLAIGSRMFYPFSDANRPQLPAGAQLIHLHADAAEIGRVTPTAIGLAGDPRAITRSLLTRLKAGGALEATIRERRQKRVAGLRELRCQALESERKASWDAQPISVTRAAVEIGRALPDNAIVVEEGVRASKLLFRHGTVPRGGAIWRSSGGALGWGLPAAVGAKLARPDRPVALLVGDGTFHFTVQALWTAVKQKAPVTIVILDNGGYLAVKRAVENYLKVPMDPRSHPGTDIGGIDHLEVARGYGAEGVRIDNASEIGEALRSGLSSGRVQVIVVPVAPLRP
jgi:benzoylformate decarboxylase